MMQVVFVLVFAVLTVLASVGPAVVYSLVVWWLDRYEKEPWGLLAATFIWGALPAIFLSLVLEVIMGVPFSGFLGEAASDVIQGSIVAPIVEESVKGLAILMVFLIFRREFDGVLDGIVYGALVGFGFAMTENGLYFLGALMEGGAASWVALVFVRTLVFGLNHGLFSGIVGVGFGYAAIARGGAWKRWLAPLVALLGAIAVHAVHNLSSTLGAQLCWPILISLVNDWGGVMVLAVIVFLSWDRERRWITMELGEEVSAGTLSQKEYELAASYVGRVGAQRRAFSSGGVKAARRVRRLYQLMTELAFAKIRLRRASAGKTDERIVSRLRDEIVATREQIAQQ
jgi:RsiW-degrading membrane proteinase PrsW (M82 family)